MPSLPGYANGSGGRTYSPEEIGDLRNVLVGVDVEAGALRVDRLLVNDAGNEEPLRDRGRRLEVVEAQDSLASAARRAIALFWDSNRATTRLRVEIRALSLAILASSWTRSRAKASTSPRVEGRARGRPSAPRARSSWLRGRPQCARPGEQRPRRRELFRRDPRGGSRSSATSELSRRCKGAIASAPSTPARYASTAAE